ncbi:MAG: hypothetical protein K2J30_04510, partial [Clostridia bacterium]|nr:hypothetical protein [Clostridia bacterium]
SRVPQPPPTQLPQAALTFPTPPYERGGFENAQADKAACRKELTLTLEELCCSASRCLKYGGRFALVHRADRAAEALYTLHANGLEPKKLQFVSGKAGAKPYCVLVVAVKGGKPGLEVLPQTANI